MNTTAPACPAVIKLINGHVGRFEYDFLYGACWELFAFLRLHYPQAQAWYDPIAGHIYTLIDGVYYDARGAMQQRPRVLNVLGIEKRRGISQMRRSAETILARINRFQIHITPVYISPYRKLP